MALLFKTNLLARLSGICFLRASKACGILFALARALWRWCSRVNFRSRCIPKYLVTSTWISPFLGGIVKSKSFYAGQRCRGGLLLADIDPPPDEPGIYLARMALNIPRGHGTVDILSDDHGDVREGGKIRFIHRWQVNRVQQREHCPLRYSLSYGVRSHLMASLSHPLEERSRICLNPSILSPICR